MSVSGEIILASASEARRRLLASAGIQARNLASELDEGLLKARFSVGDTGDIDGLAPFLASAKAESVSAANPDALVIGADQALIFKGRAIDKPTSLGEARLQLLQLRGKSHYLVSGLSVARNGRAVWTHTDRAELCMRNFSDEFLSTYLTELGEDIVTSVGAYKIESRGVQLFDRIRGDYFTILGLPLLPLMSFLRSEGCLPS
jgi:septum formation protein